MTRTDGSPPAKTDRVRTEQRLVTGPRESGHPRPDTRGPQLQSAGNTPGKGFLSHDCRTSGVSREAGAGPEPIWDRLGVLSHRTSGRRGTSRRIQNPLLRPVRPTPPSHFGTLLGHLAPGIHSVSGPVYTVHVVCPSASDPRTIKDAETSVSVPPCVTHTYSDALVCTPSRPTVTALTPHLWE